MSTIPSDYLARAQVALTHHQIQRIWYDIPSNMYCAVLVDNALIQVSGARHIGEAVREFIKEAQRREQFRVRMVRLLNGLTN